MADGGSVGAVVAVFDADGGRVLLHRREDFRVWALPGGRVEPGETPETAATREVAEETGYVVELERLVGTYRRPQLHQTVHLYAARVVGGAPLARGPETLEVAWFPLGGLPAPLAPFARGYLRDASAQADGPFERTQRLAWPAVAGLAAALRLRDLRNRWTGRGGR